MINGKKIRVLLAKSVYDAHERGIRYVAHAFREAGMEVVICRYHIIDEVAPAALEEDVDVIGLQAYSPGLMYDLSRLTEMLRERGIEDKLIVVGGTIPASAVPEIKKMGAAETFGSGSPVDKIVEFIHTNVKR